MSKTLVGPNGDVGTVLIGIRDAWGSFRLAFTDRRGAGRHLHLAGTALWRGFLPYRLRDYVDSEMRAGWGWYWRLRRLGHCDPPRRYRGSDAVVSRAEARRREGSQ